MQHAAAELEQRTGIQGDGEKVCRGDVVDGCTSGDESQMNVCYDQIGQIPYHEPSIAITKRHFVIVI